MYYYGHIEPECLQEVLLEYEQEKYRVPTWHRRDAWTEAQHAEFKKILEKIWDEQAWNGTTLPIPVVLYRVRHRGAWWVLDGVQRLESARRARQALAHYGDEVVSAVYVPVSYMSFRSHADAEAAWQEINRGTLDASPRKSRTRVA